MNQFAQSQANINGGSAADADDVHDELTDRALALEVQILDMPQGPDHDDLALTKAAPPSVAEQTFGPESEEMDPPDIADVADRCLRIKKKNVYTIHTKPICTLNTEESTISFEAWSPHNFTQAAKLAYCILTILHGEGLLRLPFDHQSDAMGDPVIETMDLLEIMFNQ